MRILLYYLAVVNLLSWILYGIDKRRSRRGKWRISERTLLLVAAIGGTAGALGGMILFRHKIRKPKFVIVVPVLFVTHCVLVGLAVQWWPK